jgi:hypothetical protein
VDLAECVSTREKGETKRKEGVGLIRPNYLYSQSKSGSQDQRRLDPLAP